MKISLFAILSLLQLSILGGCSQQQIENVENTENAENTQPSPDEVSSSIEFRDNRGGMLNFDAYIRREDALSCLHGKGGGVTTLSWDTDREVELSIVHSEGHLRVICNGTVCVSIPVDWVSITEEPKLENDRHLRVCDFVRRDIPGGPPPKKVGLYLFINRNVH